MALVHSAHTVGVISDAGPTEGDRAENDKLLQFMRDMGLFETQEETMHRVDVLGKLSEAVDKWIKLVAAHKGMAEVDIEDAHAVVNTFGSFRLEVHGPGDDIDTHCIGPRWCDRATHFFGQEAHCLEYILQHCAWVSDLQAVADAYVPVIKLTAEGIDIDLTYAQLPTAEASRRIDVQNNHLLRGMDDASVRSINGCRVTDKILLLVKDKCRNCTAFREALRFLKFWGKRRGIYSNVMGFLGGVNFAILVARICLHYPSANGAMLVRAFFKLYANWAWSDACPLMICGVDKGGPVAGSVWSPENSRLMGKPEIFPIITPCYPASNSTFNVSECTKSIMVAEIERGKQLCAETRTTRGEAVDFGRLAEPFDFFGPGSYANYLQVTVAASSVEDFMKWAGYMNSRVKHLTARLHNLQGQLIARPWPKEIKVPMELCEDGRQRTSWVIGLRRHVHHGARHMSNRIDIRTAVMEFRTTCERWAGHQPGMTIEVAHLKRDALPDYLLAAAPGPAAAAAASEGEGVHASATERAATALASAAEAHAEGGEAGGAAPARAVDVDVAGGALGGAPAAAAAEVGEEAQGSPGKRGAAGGDEGSAGQPTKRRRQPEGGGTDGGGGDAFDGAGKRAAAIAAGGNGAA